jgi:signal transduction histidine kinase/ligand-binding sensor domain-containing protein/DNA-binding response OmpR family regulator
MLKNSFLYISRKTTIILMFLAVNFSNIYGQKSIDFNYINGENGLSENVVNSIVQDSKGFIWFATNDGLNKYDGYSITHYKYDSNSNKGLSSSVLESLLVSKKGYIWIGTSEGGLNRFDPLHNKFKQFKHITGNDASIRDGIIDHIAEDKNGYLFLSIRGKGIDVLVPNKNNYSIYHYFDNSYNLKSNVSSFISKAEAGGIWTATNNGIKRIFFNPLNSSFSTEKLNCEGINPDLFAIGIIEQDKHLWITYSDGTIINAKKLSFNYAVENQFKTQLNLLRVSFAFDADKNLWVGTNNGLIKCNKSGFKYFNKSSGITTSNLITNNILSVFIDKSNILWLGTYNKGVMYTNLKSPLYFSLYNCFTEEKRNKISFFDYAVSSICEDNNGNIFIGTEGGGLARIKNGVQKLTKNEKIESIQWEFFKSSDINSFLLDDKIFSLFKDSKGSIYIGSLLGLVRLEFPKNFNNNKLFYGQKINTTKYISGSTSNSAAGAVFCIKEGKDGTIWTGNWSGGLSRLNLRTNKFENFINDPNDINTISHNTVRSIFFLSNGDAWIGTAGGGLNKMTFPNKKSNIPYFRAFKNNSTDKSSLSNNYILDITSDTDNNMWIGTFGGGLNKMIIPKKSKNSIKFETYSTDDGLPNNVVKGLLVDNNRNIWASTTRDLFKINMDSKKVEQINGKKIFNIEQFKDNAFLKLTNNMMCWGGTNGLIIFDPNKFKINTNHKDVTLTDLKIFNTSVKPNEELDGSIILTKSIEYANKIELPYKMNSIELGFSAMQYSNPEATRYKYFLEGYDEDWKETNRRFVNYTKIPSGDYIFHIKSSNNNIWDKEGQSIAIKIDAPFWASLPAFFIYFLIIIGISYFAYYIFKYRYNLRQEVKAKQAEREKIEEINNIKLTFFNNILHEFRTPLTLMLLPLENLIDSKAQKNKKLDKLNSIKRNAFRIKNLIDQLLDFRKAELEASKLNLAKMDAVAIVYEIYSSFLSIAEKKQIAYNFHTSDAEIPWVLDLDKIEKIVYNLLSNAFKFTPDKGRITVSISIEKLNTSNLDKSCLKIEINDNGIGIKESELDSVFNSFYQSENTMIGKPIGTGIGLTYAKKLVEIHGGKIDVKSDITTGTTFSFFLPFKEENLALETINSEQIKSINSEYLNTRIDTLNHTLFESDLNTKSKQIVSFENKILIVEDNIELLNLIKKKFQKEFAIITAKNGIDGINLARKELPDLIISDLMIPEMDGLEMCNILKTDVETSHIPIIMLTANINNEKEGLESGVDSYVTKPFNMDLLRLKVENLLKSRKKIIDSKNDLKFDSILYQKASDAKNKIFIDKLIQKIHDNMQKEDFDGNQLSTLIGMSRSGLYKKLKFLTDKSTSEFIRYVKLNRARALLREGRYSIEQVSYMVGIENLKYFRKCFKEIFGETPSEYLNKIKRK